MFKKTLSLIALTLCLIYSNRSFSADYSDNIHKNDFKWFQFNLLHSVNNKLPFNNQNDTFFEMEFGGRSGILDIYGFLDVLDIFDTTKSDLHNKDNLFFKFAPKISLDAATGHDLSIGPITEWYIATQTNVGDRSLFEHFIGLGADVQVPWFGKVSPKLMARYVRENFGAANERKFDGYLLSITWFKPFYVIDDKSFVTYQGFFDYTFAADKISDDLDRTSSSLAWYNGLYWHSERYAAGYGLKIYKDMGLFKDGGIAGETSGVGHYFVLTYKF
ncbi:outer membrane protein OmpK [Pseudobdellovibrio sp. HCB154]|uniref:nucleoside-specific channel-forming Tsx family protein n=1 Tax=Pseudobdellovibrio sp. HCB154 TaxID=3386277 RepID=UPI00391746EA